MRTTLWMLACSALLMVSGCSHHAQTTYTPPPPAVTQDRNPQTAETMPIAPEQTPEAETPRGRPIYSETGIASWYGPPYNKRRAANGEIYDENAVTAANRTLPMGSLVRVTNLQTGQSAMMRITDRGPFVPNRILDLSVGAAKAIGIWRAGTARVRLDVYETPKPLAVGGRWCVQIGAFSREGTAKELQEHLAREYQSANVIEFAGPTGHWVRIRPENGDKGSAIEIVRNVHLAEGAAYLVRLD